jgi:membrane associated rhomboid family serine protease
MFIPLHDRNSLRHIKRQYVTFTIILINVFVWLFAGLLSGEEASQTITAGLGYIPAIFFNNATLEPALVLVPEDWTYLTYAFLHVDGMHLASNMLFLWVFGDNVEDAMGHLRYLAFYLLCAAAGALVHGLVVPLSEAPLIGASGAISGVIAAYVILHPKVRVWVLVMFRFPLPLPAFIPLIFWIAQQFYMLAIDRDGSVSWGAHVGGILAGALLVLILRRRGVPLWDRTIVTPKAVVHETRAPEEIVTVPKIQPKNPVRWGR